MSTLASRGRRSALLSTLEGQRRRPRSRCGNGESPTFRTALLPSVSPRRRCLHPSLCGSEWATQTCHSNIAVGLEPVREPHRHVLPRIYLDLCVAMRGCLHLKVELLINSGTHGDRMLEARQVVRREDLLLLYHTSSPYWTS